MFKKELNNYITRKELLVKNNKWFEQISKKLSKQYNIKGRIISQVFHRSGAHIILADNSNFQKLFIKIDTQCYLDWQKLVCFGDIIGVKTYEDEKGIAVEDFIVYAISNADKSELNIFNQNDTISANLPISYKMVGNKKKINLISSTHFVLSTIKAVLDKNNFFQVITPELNKSFIGGNSRAFKTYSNYHHTNFYFRATAELTHKQLIAGGLNKIYEFGKSYRNEAESKWNRIGFNLLEVEAAFESIDKFKNYLFQIFKKLSQKFLTLQDINKSKIKTYKMNDLFKKHTNFNYWDAKQLRNIYPYSQLNDLFDKFDAEHLSIIIFKKYIIPKLTELCFVENIPHGESFLVSKLPNTNFANRCLIIWKGLNFGEIYFSENSPEQLLKLNNANKKEYNDFYKSIFLGLPPIIVMSMSIDRLVALLNDLDNIHDIYK